ncbi:hypothetical protein [Rhodanobacter sp. Soil772]|uniref:kynureninase/PvdN C-terminal domain-containing protein n=1 Tax=Rhodanobacter sp. Soil772 TaxID=1736406 RepID=UPI002E166115
MSLEIFCRAGVRSLRKTAATHRLPGMAGADPTRRGAQLSIRVTGGRERGRALFEYLMAHGIIGDWCEPDVIRISPAPLYNRFADCLVFAEAVLAWRRG